MMLLQKKVLDAIYVRIRHHCNKYPECPRPVHWLLVASKDCTIAIHVGHNDFPCRVLGAPAEGVTDSVASDKDINMHQIYITYRKFGDIHKIPGTTFYFDWLLYLISC